jgi:hypothetical protein
LDNSSLDGHWDGSGHNRVIIIDTVLVPERWLL